MLNNNTGVVGKKYRFGLRVDGWRQIIGMYKKK
jgi:hypothetical protein